MKPPGPEDPTGDWPDRLLDAIGKAPLVPEEALSGYEYGLDPSRTKLSPSEKRVIMGASVGLTAEMIAQVYGLGFETVKRELKTARFVLRAKNTAHAVANALRTGQIT